MQATVVAAGSRAAISWAKFGPDTTAMRCGGIPAASDTTSLMRIDVPNSMPLISETTTASAGMSLPHSLRLLRKVCDGKANTTSSAFASASEETVVAQMFAGKTKPG